GMRTTCTMETNNAQPSTGSHDPASTNINAGVTTGDKMVEMAVMDTDSGTSPLARYVITLEAVPPGTHPTNTTPTASSGGNRKKYANKNPSKGIIVNCTRTPNN